MELPPLAGVRVVDLSRVLAGPYCTMLLADLGADVVKVERPGEGDDTRSWGPPYVRDQATYFLAVNRNKRSVAIDLADPAGQREALALARASDVLVENFRPDVMDTLGLGYEQLATEQPGLIYCSISGFGAGEGARLPGYDLLVQALGGLMSITGPADGEPQKVGVALVDILAGLFASVGILAALRHRDATGEGQRVEVDLFSSLLAALANQASAFTVAGVVPRRMGNAHPSISPYELYPTAKGELVLAVGNERQFATLCEVLDVPELAEDDRFRGNARRVENRDALRDALVARLATGPAADWAAALTDARVPAGVVNDVRAAFELAASLGLEPIVDVPAPDGSAMRLTRNPIRLSRTPATYRSAPPDLPG
ncbi:MAG: carnitine dehydratase [Solirubrobacterales bacterium]|nr:MAG: carnitine dehydratase [Solirubrobacterales bacterium]